MAIRIDLAVAMAKQRVDGNELARRTGISPVDITRMRQERIRDLRLSSLEAICEALDCQPGDILRYERN